MHICTEICAMELVASLLSIRYKQDIQLIPMVSQTLIDKLDLAFIHHMVLPPFLGTTLEMRSNCFNPLANLQKSRFSNQRPHATTPAVKPSIKHSFTDYTPYGTRDYTTL